MTTQPPLICSEFGLVRNLGAAGIPIIAGTEEPKNSAFYSKFTKRKIVFSNYESPEFINELIEVSEELHYNPVIMSYDDRVIMNISRNRDKLANYFKFLLPEKDMVENLLDKLKFVELSEEHDLPTPASEKVLNTEDLKRADQNLKKPYLIKPLYRHHWFHEDFTKIVGTYKKAYVCHTFEELKDLYTRLSKINPHVVVQEYIEGPDHHMYDINLYVDENEDIKGSIVAQKLRVYPPVAGYGSYVTTVNDNKLLELTHSIVKKLHLRGLLNVQFKKDINSGEFKLIEIHMRTSIFDVLGIKAKMNLPAIYYHDMIGQPLPLNGGCKSGVKYFNIGRDLRLFLKNRKSYGLTLSKMMKSYSGSSVIDGFSIKDPLPALMDTWWMIRKLLYK